MFLCKHLQHRCACALRSHFRRLGPWIWQYSYHHGRKKVAAKRDNRRKKDGVSKNRFAAATWSRNHDLLLRQQTRRVFWLCPPDAQLRDASATWYIYRARNTSSCTAPYHTCIAKSIVHCQNRLCIAKNTIGWSVMNPWNGFLPKFWGKLGISPHRLASGTHRWICSRKHFPGPDINLYHHQNDMASYCSSSFRQFMRMGIFQSLLIDFRERV